MIPYTNPEDERKLIPLHITTCTVMIPTTNRRRKTNTHQVFVSVTMIAPILLIFLGSSFRFLPAVKASKDETFPLPIVPYDGVGDGDNNHEEDLSSLLGEIDSFVTDAVSYLVRISHNAKQDPTFPGRFTYQADLREDLQHSLKMNHWKHKDQPDYNLLRHNGAIYALSQAYNRNEERRNSHNPTSTDVDQVALLQTMERAVGYLRDIALLPVPGHNEWLAAWERIDTEDPHSEPYMAKLGGAGLAMIAMGRLEGIKKNSVSLEKELRKLGAFVESLQDKYDGSFTCKYSWRDGPSNEWVSLYYPGEATLGLVTLAELELQKEEGIGQRKMVTSAELELEHQHHHRDPHGSQTQEKLSGRWIRVATNALLYLERLRRDQELDTIEPDHWALLGTARLLPILDKQRHELADGHPRKQADLEYRLVYNHGVRVAQSMVHDHTTDGLSSHKGCFTYDSRTCPTATRLEGLLAAMTFIEDSEVFFGDEHDATELLKDRIERDMDMGIRFLLTTQQKSDRNDMRGAVPGKFTGRQPVFPIHRAESNDDDPISTKAGTYENENENEPESEDKDFNLAEVRVDYVQHSMSAVMAYETFLLDKLEKRHAQKGFHEKVHENVHKVHEKVHKVVHRVKLKINTATASEVFVNYAILGAICLLAIVVICLAYFPWSWPRFLARHRRRRRRVKREE